MYRGKTIWSFCGGVRGVGVSTAAANIGACLARRGNTVVLIDADRGANNLHNYLGIKYPEKSLGDFLNGSASGLEDVCMRTSVEGLYLLSGACELLASANPAGAKSERLLSGIAELKYEYMIADMGASSTYDALDFFSASSAGIVVLTPEYAAAHSAYAFLKGFVYRRLLRLFSGNRALTELVKEATDPGHPGSVRSLHELCERIFETDPGAAGLASGVIKGFRPKVLLNMASSVEHTRVVDALVSASNNFLGLGADFIGALCSDPAISAAGAGMRPFALDDGAWQARSELEAVVENLLRPSSSMPAADKQAAHRPGKAIHQPFGFNSNISHNGTVFHVQTEVRGGQRPLIETLVFHGGRVCFAKKTVWEDVLRDEGEGASIREFAARQHRSAIDAVKTDRIKR